MKQVWGSGASGGKVLRAGPVKSREDGEVISSMHINMQV